MRGVPPQSVYRKECLLQPSKGRTGYALKFWHLTGHHEVVVPTEYGSLRLAEPATHLVQ